MSKSNRNISAEFIKQEEGKTYFLINKNEYFLPSALFPKNLIKGDQVNIYIVDEKQDEKDRESVAKKLLNDILKN